MHSQKTCIRPSTIPGAGYGVFATQDIQPGELLETAPFIEVPTQVVYERGKNLLQHYVFASHNKPRHVLVVFGTGSMYNCSPQPNAKYAVNTKNPKRMLDFYCYKPIKRGEEIFINYNREEV